jgi:hypothetical protein
MITGGTLYKQHFFNSGKNLRMLQSFLFETVKSFGWTLEAWALLSDHYHLIASADEKAREMSPGFSGSIRYRPKPSTGSMAFEEGRSGSSIGTSV